MIYYYFAKPTFRFIYEQAYKKLNNNRPNWSKGFCFDYEFLEVYKYFTLLKSMIKMDFVLNVFFFITSYYFSHSGHSFESFDFSDLQYLVFFILITTTATIGIRAIKRKDETMQSLIGLLRVLVELFKIMKVILILNGIDSSFSECKHMLINLGNIRFSVLVQEIFSMALFIPILALGRLIFYGFSIRKFSNVFDVCIALNNG